MQKSRKMSNALAIQKTYTNLTKTGVCLRKISLDSLVGVVSIFMGWDIITSRDFMYVCSLCLLFRVTIRWSST